MIEGRIMSAMAKKFQKKLHFVGIQVSEGVKVNKSSAKQIFRKLKSKLREYGVQSNTLPEAYLGGSSSKVWRALLKGSSLYSKETSIPLFVLFDRKRSPVKVWKRSVYETREELAEFIHTIEDEIARRR
jgi:hypothetical protein